MKKIFLSLLALCAVALVSCGSNKTFTETEKAFNEATKELVNITSYDEYIQFATAFQTKLQNIADETGDTMSEDEQAKLMEMALIFSADCQAKLTELTTSVSTEEIIIEE